MAAYASTVTLASPKAYRIQGSPFGFLTGRVNLTNYNATTSEETGITGKFKPMTVGASTFKLILINEGTSSNGYSISFDPVLGKFKAWQQASTGAMTEAADNTDIGTFEFLGVGIPRA